MKFILMKNVDTKQKLFETMEKLNPDFKQIEEITITQPNTPPIQQTGVKPSTDVAYLNKVRQRTTSLQNANSKINTTMEFQAAFQDWFNTLGYNPETNPISIGMVQTYIRKAMINLGYK